MSTVNENLSGAYLDIPNQDGNDYQDFPIPTPNPVIALAGPETTNIAFVGGNYDLSKYGKVIQGKYISENRNFFQNIINNLKPVRGISDFPLKSLRIIV